jgi:MoxR-like ATPase
MPSLESVWMLYRAEGQPCTPPNRLASLPPAPSWRAFGSGQKTKEPNDLATNDFWVDAKRGADFRLKNEDVIQAVNAALYLRRPLLVTGRPGTGKSSLIYSVAYELRMGPVLKWSITSRSTVKNGLYEYDALRRLNDIREREAGRPVGDRDPEDIGNYLSLGSLGTALYPTDWPRALLIDEIDKADLDLPNDLLNIFEDGEFTIPELERDESVQGKPYKVKLRGSRARCEIPLDGRVRVRQFPFVVLTSNGEREFPGPFLRRCIRIQMPDPNLADLRDIVEAHLGSDRSAKASQLMKDFLKDKDKLATDQLLNAVFLTIGSDRHATIPTNPEERKKLEGLLLKHLS